MNILFDLNHPAHFHLFKNLISELKKKKHRIWITARHKDVLIELLNDFELPYIKLKKTRNKILDHFINLNTLRGLFKSKKIDLAVGVSALIAQAALLTKTKSLVLDDDDISATPLFAFASHSFANHIIVPSVLQSKNTKKKYIFHQSLHELAYLHPLYFKPEENILSTYHLNKNEHYYILRLSALNAHHDIGEKGIDYQKAIQILELLETKGKVFISSENKLPKNLKKYNIQSPLHFQQLLAFAQLLVCDSQTVASEAAVMGVPSVRINTFVKRISYLEELEHKYQLTFGFLPDQLDMAIEKIKELIGHNNNYDFKKNRENLLKDKISLSAFLVWFIENYPKSVKTIKENPDYQYRFQQN